MTYKGKVKDFKKKKGLGLSSSKIQPTMEETEIFDENEYLSNLDKKIKNMLQYARNDTEMEMQNRKINVLLEEGRQNYPLSNNGENILRQMISRRIQNRKIQIDDEENELARESLKADRKRQAQRNNIQSHIAYLKLKNPQLLENQEYVRTRVLKKNSKGSFFL